MHATTIVDATGPLRRNPLVLDLLRTFHISSDKGGRSMFSYFRIVKFELVDDSREIGIDGVWGNEMRLVCTVIAERIWCWFDR